MSVRVVGAAIVDSLGQPSQILVAQRSAPASLAGLWEFPGGKVECGESAESALCRELREELGVASDLGAEVTAPSADAWPLANGATMRVWLAEVAGKPVALQDHAQLRWYSLRDPEAVLSLEWIPADRPIIVAVLQRLSAGRQVWHTP